MPKEKKNDESKDLKRKRRNEFEAATSNKVQKDNEDQDLKRKRGNELEAAPCNPEGYEVPENECHTPERRSDYTTQYTEEKLEQIINPRKKYTERYPQVEYIELHMTPSTILSIEETILLGELEHQQHYLSMFSPNNKQYTELKKATDSIKNNLTNNYSQQEMLRTVGMFGNKLNILNENKVSLGNDEITTSDPFLYA